MAENKKSFIAYCDWINTFEELTDEEAGRLAKHIWRYVNDMNPVAPDRLTNILFLQIKNVLKLDLAKWEDYINKQRLNGTKGGRPKKEETQKTQAFFSKPKKADNVIVNVNDNVIVNDNVNGVYNTHTQTPEKANLSFDEIKEKLTGEIYLDEVCSSNSFDRLDFLQFTIQWLKDRKITDNLNYHPRLLRLYCIEDFRKQLRKNTTFDKFKKSELNRTSEDINAIAAEIAAEIELEKINKQ